MLLLDLHGLDSLLIRLLALEHLDQQQGAGAGPQAEGKGGEDGVGTRSGAYLSTAVQELAEEYGEGDEAGEVEQGVQDGECKVSVWVGYCG